MDLIRLLIKTSSLNVFLSIGAGLLSGVSSFGLVALINFGLQQTSFSRTLLVLFFLGFCILMLISMAVSQMYTNRATEQLIFTLQLDFTRRIIACPLQHLEELGIPRLLAAITQDIQSIANTAIYISSLCVYSALLLGCFAYLIWLSLPWFGLTVLFIILGSFSYSYLLNQGRNHLVSAREEQDYLFQHFRTVTEGVKELKLNQKRYKHFAGELRATSRKAQNHRIAASDRFAIGGSWGFVAIFVLIGILLFIVPLLFPVSSSVLSGYILTILFMITPLRGVLLSLPELLRANVALEKVRSLGLLLTTQNNESESVIESNNISGWQSLRLQEISHTYRSEREDSNFTLGPVTFTLRPGEVLFVIGGNGSGKSTLVKLLTGLYVPELGFIELDGQQIDDNNRNWYRQKFSVVFSDFYLFDKLLSSDNFNSSSQAQLYLKKLHLDHKVKIENGAFSTTSLSQGQRRRLALLTAYLDDREVFVFDEWASDQDPMFKKIFYTQILGDLKNRGKAVVVVTHDDHYFDQADHILKLDYGKVEYINNCRVQR